MRSGPRQFRRFNGDLDSELSKYCPKCGNSVITHETGENQEFDETGWFYLITLICGFPACKHVWHERLILTRPSRKLN